VTWRRFWRRHLLLVAIPVATIVPYLFLHVEPRYVLPASFVYMILFGVGADSALNGRADPQVQAVEAVTDSASPVAAAPAEPDRTVRS
jgi:O-antigen ligase